MSSVSDFCGPPLVLGEIYGARSFLFVPETGELAAEYSPYVWTPGVNEAKHIVTAFSDNSCQDSKIEILECPGPVSCQRCGMYAYTEGRLEYGTPTTSVLGIIKGWGVTQVGSKGFRCSKAEIVALYSPNSSLTKPANSRFVRLVRWWQRHFWSPWWSLFFAALYLVCAVLGAIWVSTAFTSLPALGLMIFNGYCKTSIKYDGYLYRRHLENSDIDFNLVRIKYPDVKWYSNLQKMISDYELKINTSELELLYRLLYGTY